MGNDSSHNQVERRTGKDRRQFTFTLHIPERRKGKERRGSEGKKEESKASSPKLKSKQENQTPDEN